MTQQTQRPKAVPTVQVSTDEVIVTEWRFAPGAETGRHRHGLDYVVVPMTDGTLLLETPEGDKHAPWWQARATSAKPAWNTTWSMPAITRSCSSRPS